MGTVLTTSFSRLLKAAEEAMKRGSRVYLDIVNVIREDHVKAVKSQVKNQAILDQAVVDIELECTRLSSFLGAAQVWFSIFPNLRNKHLTKDLDH